MSRILGRSQSLSCLAILPHHRLHGTSAARNRTTERSDSRNAIFCQESVYNGYDQLGKIPDYGSTVSGAREVPTPNRLPIIINGAGPAGLILAIRLKNAKIPFEIFEKEEQDLLSKRLRRNHVSYLGPRDLSILRKLLSFSTEQRLLQKIANHFSENVSESSKGVSISFEALMQLLRKQVDVHYGHTLERHAISCRANVMNPQYATRELVRTFRGCLIVGADGKFSAGRP